MHKCLLPFVGVHKEGALAAWTQVEFAIALQEWLLPFVEVEVAESSFLFPVAAVVVVESNRMGPGSLVAFELFGVAASEELLEAGVPQASPRILEAHFDI